MTDQLITQLRPMPEDWQRALAVVAHPDDLEYGCSAAVAAWTDRGREIAYVLASRGAAGIDTRSRCSADDDRGADTGRAVRGAPRPSERRGLPHARLARRGGGRRPGGLAETEPQRHRGRPQPRRLADQFVLVNGELGMLNAPDGQLLSITGLTIADGRITGMYILADPERLARLDLPDLGG